MSIPRAFLYPTCAECGRTFDLTDAADAEEWAYGHDCEVPETDTPRDTVADILNRHGIPHTIGPNGLRVTSQDSAEHGRT